MLAVGWHQAPIDEAVRLAGGLDQKWSSHAGRLIGFLGCFAGGEGDVFVVSAGAAHLEAGRFVFSNRAMRLLGTLSD